MQLELSSDFLRFREETGKIQSKLNRSLSVDDFRYVAYRSAEPLSIIKLLGEAVEWAPLTIPATIYLSTIAKRAGDATWEMAKSLIQSDKVKPLVLVASTLAEIADKSHAKAQVAVGITFPDDNYVIEFPIKFDTSEEVIRNLSVFVLQSENLSNIMQAEIQEGRGPIGSAVAEIQEDGSLLVMWTRKNDLKKQEFKIPRLAED